MSVGASGVRKVLIWAGLAVVIALPIILAATSPLLAYRDPAYILGGFAGIIAMTLLLLQPLLVGGYLPGIDGRQGRQVHRLIGTLLVFAIISHVAALWVTSPPDVIDALLFVSPTPFSAWGVIAMWAVFAAALLAAIRRRIKLSPRIWRRAHTTLAVVTVIGSVVHAMLIEGTMEVLSKAVLCALVVGATLTVLVALRVWGKRPTQRS
ncbi:ferric reductase-like transmembrane domain-containing protein [bacterium]|nr:ferric reductase-like transmembrane domain-containing protein [bacterium]